jgi:hypothetical protein
MRFIEKLVLQFLHCHFDRSSEQCFWVSRYPIIKINCRLVKSKMLQIKETLKINILDFPLQCKTCERVPSGSGLARPVLHTSSYSATPSQQRLATPSLRPAAPVESSGPTPCGLLATPKSKLARPAVCALPSPQVSVITLRDLITRSR